MRFHRCFILHVLFVLTLVPGLLPGTVNTIFAQDTQPLDQAVLLPPPRMPDIQPSDVTEVSIANYRYSFYLPVVVAPVNEHFLDVKNRQSVKDYYLMAYKNTAFPDSGWNGSQATCNASDTSQEFRDAVLGRINFFRRMAGVPDTVIFISEYIQKAQAAALMMSAEDDLNHFPGANWACYSDLGSSGASSSNLALGFYGWNAINAYMQDFGSNNDSAGHRRWILYPQTREMGTGDIPGGNGYRSANALVVFDDYLKTARPATRDNFVAWPPAGYVPYPIVYARWSFSYAKADFSAATVSMTSNGITLPVSVHAAVNGYGENTLVWIPNGMSNFASWPKPAADTIYTVTLQNVKIKGVPKEFTYDVIIFDPDR